jgi:hypothetical protein
VSITIGTGVDFDRWWYWRIHNPQPYALKDAGHTTRALLGMAPLAFWEARYTGQDWYRLVAAAGYTMARCRAKGIYDPEDERGRGAWIEDDGRLVLHTGKKLIVESTEIGSMSFDLATHTSPSMTCISISASPF